MTRLSREIHVARIQHAQRASVWTIRYAVHWTVNNATDALRSSVSAFRITKALKAARSATLAFLAPASLGLRSLATMEILSRLDPFAATGFASMAEIVFL